MVHPVPGGKDAGRMAGPNRTNVGSVERSERNVSIDNIAKLAAALGVEAASLLRDQPRR